MNVTIIFFSQTGNTRKVAENMATVFQEAGHSVQTIPLKKATPDDATKCDLLGIGAPCFVHQAPTPIKNYLRSLPSLNSKRSFVFATSAAAPGRVLYDMTKLLQHKGANVIGGFLARGEIYYPVPYLIGKFPGHPNEEDLDRARHFASAVIEHVSASHSGPLPESRTDALRPGRRLYDLMGLAFSDPSIRLVMPEPKPDPTKCDQCQWCVYECPMDNITLQPYPVLDDRCIRCYRCLTGCPQEAFSLGKVQSQLFNVVATIMYNPHFGRWFGDLKPGEQVYG